MDPKPMDEMIYPDNREREEALLQQLKDETPRNRKERRKLKAKERKDVKLMAKTK